MAPTPTGIVTANATTRAITMRMTRVRTTRELLPLLSLFKGPLRQALAAMVPARQTLLYGLATPSVAVGTPVWAGLSVIGASPVAIWPLTFNLLQGPSGSSGKETVMEPITFS